ncbi:phage tail family protein [Listeria monocytogenes]|nr:phage tail protein [Listeria monocytogenes]EKZ0837003.1 phage tail family protein [Listeria monocytogenes]EKZ0839973.1 phage tail family protein [Listeria monocytogenes]EKZ3617138.1 phage tail family protein [Listeria monocytogenes]ELA3174112.1 phage tail family protein [Listeria monocytogenes]
MYNNSINEFGFSFAGSHSSLYNLKIIDIRRVVIPPSSEIVQNIEGMDGAVYQGNNIGQRPFEIDVKLVSNTHESRLADLHDISDWLWSDKDNEYSLIFDDEPDLEWFAHVSNISEVNRTKANGFFTIAFNCSDVLGYMEKETVQVAVNPFIITPQGTRRSNPIISMIPYANTRKIAVVQDEEDRWAYLGEDVDPETGNIGVDKSPLVYQDECNTLAPWTTLSSSNIPFALENGFIYNDAKMISNHTEFRIGSKNGAQFWGGNGTTTENWHGAAVMKMMDAELDNWSVKFVCHNYTYYPRAKGKVELYLLDKNKSKIGVMTLKKNSVKSSELILEVKLFSGSKNTFVYSGTGPTKKGKTVTKTVRVKLGGKTVKVKVKGTNKTKTEQAWSDVKIAESTTTSMFSNFYGEIILEKRGNKFTLLVNKYNKSRSQDPKFTPIRITKTLNDYKGLSLSGVAYYNAKMDIYEDNPKHAKGYSQQGMSMSFLRVNKLFENTPSGVDYVANSRDEVKFNAEDKHVYINGTIQQKNWAIGGELPIFDGGHETTLAFSHSPYEQIYNGASHNLIRNSTWKEGKKFWTNGDANGNPYRISNPEADKPDSSIFSIMAHTNAAAQNASDLIFVEKGKEYLVSCDVRLTKNDKSSDIFFCVRTFPDEEYTNAAAVATSTFYIRKSDYPNWTINQWYRLTFSFTADDNWVRIIPYNSDVINGTRVDYREVKMTDNLTDIIWSPAPIETECAEIYIEYRPTRG